MITRIFSSVARNERGDGWLELRYDDAIRVVMPLRPQIAMPAPSSLLDDQAADVLRLQGTGITSLSCPNPNCVRGVPPVEQGSDQIQFAMQMQATAHIEAMDGGPSCLIACGSSARVAIPIVDASLGTDWALCNEMKKYRQRAQMAHGVAFHVYLIAVAPAPLAALQNKRIALPIPSELVAAVGGDWMRSSA
jgi:hypothetical protein